MTRTHGQLSYLHPAVLIALLDQICCPRLKSLAEIDPHLRRDIGIDPGKPGMGDQSPLAPAPGESGSPRRSAH